MADNRESNLTNLFETTLTAPVGPTDLTYSVASMVGAPASPCFLFIRSASGSQWEIIDADGTYGGSSFASTAIGKRYLTGSSAASGLTHAAGSIVQVRPVAQYWQQAHDRIDAVDADVQTLAATSVVLLAESILGATAASVTFASIPQTHRHLRLVVAGKSTDANVRPALQGRINGDTGANYNSHRLQVLGTTVSGAAAAAGTAWAMGYVAGSFGTSRDGMVDVLLPDYTRTREKLFTATTSIIPNATTTDFLTATSSGRHNLTAAITSLELYPSLGSWAAGSVFSLYGMGQF